jgi:hypothetical protein
MLLTGKRFTPSEKRAKMAHRRIEGVVFVGDLQSAYFEFSPETKILRYKSSDKLLSKHVPVPDIGSVRESGMVLGCPVYIGAPADFGDSLDGIASIAKIHSDVEGGDVIWIYLPDGIGGVRIITLSRDLIEETYAESGELLTMPLQSGEILKYATQLLETDYPLVAFVFYGEDRQQYPYILKRSYSGDECCIRAEMLETSESGDWILKQ